MDDEILRLVGAVDRAITTRDRDGRPVRLLVASRTYETAIDDLWDALTNADRLPRWFLPISGDLQVGGRYQLEGNAGGEVLDCDPPLSFEVTWEYGGDVSWVTMSLTPAGEHTRLELQHVAPVSDDMWIQFGPGAVGIGWDLGLMGLDRHLASADALDPAEIAQWSASDEGRAFIGATSDAWCEASIAAGTDAATAREAAARTTGAYTASEDPN